MRLTRVDIVNFRSIKNATVSFESRCRTLVGINESGKSNILKALALLDPERPVQDDDLRDFPPDEDADQPAYVRFVFTLEEDERKSCSEKAEEKVLATDSTAPIVDRDGKQLSVAQLAVQRTEAIYTVNIRRKTKYATYWGFVNSIKVVGDWVVPSPPIPADVFVKRNDGALVPVSEYRVIHRSLVTDLPESLFVPLTEKFLEKHIGEIIQSFVTENLPDCLYWTYSDSQLLPGQIVLDSFASNPSSCEPLRQMFALAGCDPVNVAITDAKKKPNGIRNLLNRVATIATKHMREVWEEYRGVTIELSSNGPHIDACVKDHFNLYNFDRRSDGFKRFISFLLLVSARVKNDELTNTLYIHDEPDIGLHPSGARYLRDELIKISEENYVVFSTHSIFMVDREEIGRHLIVRKVNEVTSVELADASNIVDEEVLYNALGYSLFETLRERNIIFEGWRDKHLFRTAMKSGNSRVKKLQRFFTNVGFCHAKGVKDVARITPMLELARRKWIVVSDADAPAKEHQKDYHGDGPWFRYDEFISDCQAVTSLLKYSSD